MTCDAFDDEHGLRAERAPGLSTWSRLLWRSSDAEQEAATQQGCGSSAVSEKSKVPDADEPLGQNVDEESPQELIGGDGHDLLLAAVSVVLPEERDLSFAESYEPMVGDGDAVRVAGEIVEHMLSAAEGWLSIDDPLLRVKLSQELTEALWAGQLLE
jgi:hypothetical protein